MLNDKLKELWEKRNELAAQLAELNGWTEQEGWSYAECSEAPAWFDARGQQVHTVDGYVYLLFGTKFCIDMMDQYNMKVDRSDTGLRRVSFSVLLDPVEEAVTFEGVAHGIQEALVLSIINFYAYTKRTQEVNNGTTIIN